VHLLACPFGSRGTWKKNAETLWSFWFVTGDLSNFLEVCRQTDNGKLRLLVDCCTTHPSRRAAAKWKCTQHTLHIGWLQKTVMRRPHASQHAACCWQGANTRPQRRLALRCVKNAKLGRHTEKKYMLIHTQHHTPSPRGAVQATTVQEGQLKSLQRPLFTLLKAVPAGDLVAKPRMDTPHCW
jgi:hypothetical protein